MSVSSNVEIMTSAELRTYGEKWFQKGVERGRFEQRCDESRAKEPEASARGRIPGGEVRVGEASADLPTTSEIMDVTAGETAPNREASLLEALEFYADPFAWKKRNDPQNLVRIPDFYSELDFGGAAKEALASFTQAVAETHRTESAGSTPPAEDGA